MNEKVLCVDDEANVLAGFQRNLRRQFKLETAQGGEAALALHYYRVLRARGAQVWLIAHERTRAELMALFPNEGNLQSNSVNCVTCLVALLV